MEETSKNPIQVSEKLFQVIETLADNGPMGIMELSGALGFHKSTTHRLVTSLQCLGYVRQEEDSLKYATSADVRLGGLGYITLKDGVFLGPIAKFLSDEQKKEILKLQAKFNGAAVKKGFDKLMKDAGKELEKAGEAIEGFLEGLKEEE